MTSNGGFLMVAGCFYVRYKNCRMVDGTLLAVFSIGRLSNNGRESLVLYRIVRNIRRIGRYADVVDSTPTIDSPGMMSLSVLIPQQSSSGVQ